MDKVYDVLLGNWKRRIGFTIVIFAGYLLFEGKILAQMYNNAVALMPKLITIAIIFLVLAVLVRKVFGKK